MMRSPTLPRMVGPWNLALSRMTSRSTPSGLAQPHVATSLYLRWTGLTRSQTCWHVGDSGDATRTHAGMEQKYLEGVQMPNWEQHSPGSAQAPTYTPHTPPLGTGGRLPTVLPVSGSVDTRGWGRLAVQADPGPL
jgi:hypothetical protein